MPRARSSIFPLFAVAIMLAALPVALGSAACGTSAGAETIPPITGVTVRAETLSAGRGCGTAPDQLFKYVVVVFGLAAADAKKPPVARPAGGEYVASNVYDCFTDGTFVDLPLVGGSSLYRLDVYGYNRAAYVASGAGLEAAIRRLQDNRVALNADGGGAQQAAAIQTDLAVLRGANPTYSTTCTAEQVGLVQSLAVCRPLELGAAAIGTAPAAASVELSLARFPKGAGFVTCDDQYVTVRASYRIGAVRVPATDRRCSALTEAGLVPQTLAISPADAPASYVFDVTLLRPDGTLLGATTCGADTSPGLKSTADCQPLP